MAQLLLCRAAMLDDDHFRHMGGGRKGAFLVLRYLFIAAASYLIIFQVTDRSLPTGYALMIVVALGSNVALSLAPAHLVFSWYVEAPVLIADTLWVSWAVHATGTSGQEFFLLYFFVLCLSAMGENLAMILLGSTVISAANLYFSPTAGLWSSAALLRIVFFYTVALFYGYVINQIKQERQRATRGLAWARELEAKVAERTDELRRLYNQAQAASRLKSEFVATMSHELRTPLNVIIGYIELLIDGEFDPLTRPQADTLQLVDKRAWELLELINSTLDMNRLESGKMPLDLTTVDLHDLLSVVEAGTRGAGEKAGVRLEWQVPGPLPPLHTDPAKLKTVLRNLVNNALKFTAEGSVTIGARAAEGGAEIWVRDTGIGIPPAVLPVIFDPFRQADSSDTRRHGGVGLGLYIVRRLLDMLGGTIAVESQVGQGSTFRVWLPSASGPDRYQGQPVDDQLPWADLAAAPNM